MKEQITEALKEFIIANRELRNNPISWRSVKPYPTDPEWLTYSVQQSRYERAEMELWSVTDVEFAEDGFRNLVWEWRYWKVMARKCCWYQTVPLLGYKAGRTMAELQRAEYNFVKACDLLAEYKPASAYIEEQFPKLKDD